MTPSTPSLADKNLATPDGTVRFRPIGDEDQPILFKIYAATRADEMELVDWPESQKQKFLAMQFHAQHTYYVEHYADGDFLLILLDDEIIGRLYLVEWEREFRIVDIALLPEFRNKGLGTIVLKDIFAQADAAGFAVSIHVERFNPARRLYERLGFRLKEEHEIYLLMQREASEP